MVAQGVVRTGGEIITESCLMFLQKYFRRSSVDAFFRHSVLYNKLRIAANAVSRLHARHVAMLTPPFWYQVALSSSL